MRAPAETGRALPQVSLAVVGVEFLNPDKSNRRFAIAELDPGEEVELRPEPKNPADALAVAVWSPRGVQLGYLTAERCGRIGALIRQGREVQAVFQGRAKFGAWIRVAFDGEAPVLPEAATDEAVWADEDHVDWGA